MCTPLTSLQSLSELTATGINFRPTPLRWPALLLAVHELALELVAWDLLLWLGRELVRGGTTRAGHDLVTARDGERLLPAWTRVAARWRSNLSPIASASPP